MQPVPRRHRSTLRHPGGAKRSQKPGRVGFVTEPEDPIVVADNRIPTAAGGSRARRPSLRPAARSRCTPPRENCIMGDNRAPAPCSAAVQRAPPPAVPRAARTGRRFPTRTADWKGSSASAMRNSTTPACMGARHAQHLTEAGPARRVAGVGSGRRAGDLHRLIVPARERQHERPPDQAQRQFGFERHGTVREAERGIQRGTPARLAPSEGEPALHSIGLVHVHRRVVRIGGDGAIEHPARDRRVRFGRQSVQFPALKIQVIRVQVGRRRRRRNRRKPSRPTCPFTCAAMRLLKSSCTANRSSSGQSKRSAHRLTLLRASVSRTVMRSRPPARRTAPPKMKRDAAGSASATASSGG